MNFKKNYLEYQIHIYYHATSFLQKHYKLQNPKRKFDVMIALHTKLVEDTPHWAYPTIFGDISQTHMQQFLVVIFLHLEDLMGPKSASQSQGKAAMQLKKWTSTICLYENLPHQRRILLFKLQHINLNGKF